jgi:hypothetical protein
LPPLECVVVTNGKDDVSTPLTVPALDFDISHLEPAFVQPQQYPTGWIVYHPVLGLVEKEKADSYNPLNGHAKLKANTCTETPAKNISTTVTPIEVSDQCQHEPLHPELNSPPATGAKINNSSCQIQTNGDVSYSNLPAVMLSAGS